MRTLVEILNKIEELSARREEIGAVVDSFGDDGYGDEFVSDLVVQVSSLDEMIGALTSLSDSSNIEMELADQLSIVSDRVERLKGSVERIEDTDDEDMLVELAWRMDDLYVCESVCRILRWVEGVKAI